MVNIEAIVKEMDKLHKDYFTCLGVFPPHPATFSAEAVNYVWQLNDITKTMEILDQWTRFELIIMHKKDNECRYSIPQETLNYARHLLEPRRRKW